ncbi:MAG TPA: ATP-dependent DNA helicase RecQ, partial [Tepidisphaeraceae bacterium]
MPDLDQILHERFGLSAFRPMQREVMEYVLDGRDVVCVMPTGAGKSLCYQLPAVTIGGLTVVVSPLISLMQDQVRQLHARGITAAFLNSSQTPGEQRDVLEQVQQGEVTLLYVAPERFFAASFQESIDSLRPKILAIDEAHCISSWGHDFRPEYSRLGEVRDRLGGPPCIALTATATDDVREDIIHRLGLSEPQMVVTGFDRPNLTYEAKCLERGAEKLPMIEQLLTTEKGSAIVYCSTRKNVDAVSMQLRSALSGRKVVAYHAGMDQASRAKSQNLFMDTAGAVAVATNAFGMGINKPDIRLVIHHDTPGTLEAYYQEAGRAGRDGLPARCVLLYHFADRMTQEFFINNIGTESGGQAEDADWIKELKDRATAKLDLMTRYARIARCRRQQILDYFGDEQTLSGCTCDVCRGEFDQGEVTEATTLIVRQLLAGIARMNARFGLVAVAEVLAGISSERATRWQLDQLTVFGLLKSHGSKKITQMLHRLVEAGLARQRDPDGQRRPILEISPSGVKVM